MFADPPAPRVGLSQRGRVQADVELPSLALNGLAYVSSFQVYLRKMIKDGDTVDGLSKYNDSCFGS